MKSVAVSSALAAILGIVLLVVGAGAGYYIGLSGASGGGTATTTVTSFASGQGGGGATVTVTSTVNSGGVSGGVGNLTALARAEGGSLTMYGLLPANVFATAVNAPFTKLYPWVKINYVSLTTSTVLSKIEQEQSAGHVIGDVISLPPQAYLSLGQGNLTAFNNPSMVNTGWPNNTIPQGWGSYLAPFQGGLVVIAYNTKLMTSAQAPKSWLDLNNTAYKGVEAIWKPAAGSSNIALLIDLKYQFHMSTTAWKNFLTGINNNNYVRASDFGSAFTDVDTGGASMCICQVDDVAAGQAKGSSVTIDWTVPEIYQFTNFLAIPKGASHPYTAQLLMQWVSGYAGQASLATGRLPMFAPLFSAYLGNEGVTVTGNHTYPYVVGPGYLNPSNYTAMNSAVTGIMSQ